MRRRRLAAAALLPLLLGLAAPVAFAETAEPEPPRNRLSPTDDSELTPRATPPLAPPQPLVPRRINELPKEPEAPRTAAPTPAPAPEATPKPALKSAMKHQPTIKRTVARKTTTAQKTAAPKRTVTTARPPRQDDSLGALFAPGRTPQRVSPEAPPSTLTYNYLGMPPAPANAGPCPSRPGTSLSALFACQR